MLSVVIITFNESLHIKRCIESVSTIADEIVVVDSFSTDDTVQIAKSLGVKVFQNEFVGYGQQKNWGIEQTVGDFIFSLDADEVADDELKRAINQFVSSKNQDAAFCNRKNHIADQWIRYGGWYPDWKLRLWKKGLVHWNANKVHEKALPIKPLKTVSLEGNIIHNSFKSLDDHKLRVEKYAQLKASILFEKKISKSRMPQLKAAFRFFKLYVLKAGFLDGKIGYQIARNSAQGEIIKARSLSSLHDSKNG